MIRSLSLANSADTIKIGMNLSDVQVESFESWGRSTPQNSDIVTYTYIPYDVHGITSIRATPAADKVSIETSAKLMGNAYREGIHIGNLEQYAEMISRKAGVISVTADVIHDANVYRIDPCQTIEPAELPERVVKALMLLDVKKGYQFRPHTGGQVITRKAKSRNDRTVVYAKLAELYKADNKKFLEQYPGVLQSFTEHSTRFEYQIRKLSDMRAVYQTADTTLGSLLGADVNPVHSNFTTIAKDYNRIISKFSNMAEHSTGNKMSKIKDMALVEFCNYDLHTIMMLIDRHIKGNPSYYRSKYRKLITEMKATEAENTGHTGIIHTVSKMLSEAV